jgi:N-methylhydantoinase A/oxoprolinase/acetone carboxylase beta subunit
LTVPWSESDTGAAFHAAHQRTYGYSDAKKEIEIVTVRVRARKHVPAPPLAPEPGAATGQTGARRVYSGGRWRQVPALERNQAGKRLKAGPALVLDYGSTTLVPPGWTYRSAEAGNLILGAA